MPRFTIRIHTRHGVQNQEIDARDGREAEMKAAARGAVISVKRSRGLHLSTLSYNERQTFLSQLSAMMASRVSATDALKLLRDTFSGRIRFVAGELLLKVGSGSTVTEAIAALGGRDFPGTTVAMIQAGANSGDTAQALRDAMDFEQHLRKIRKESSRGVWGAIFVFLISIVFVIATLLLGVPTIMNNPLMKMTGGAENFQSSIEVAYGTGYVMVGVLAVLVGMFMLATVGRSVAPSIAESIIMRIPIYKDLVLAKGQYIAFYGLSLLVGAGMRMDSALELLAQTTQGGLLKADFMRARDAVGRGQPWQTGMTTLRATDRAALGASLDRTQTVMTLKAVALSFRDTYAQRVAVLTPVLQTLAVIGLLVAGLIILGLTVLPMLTMSASVMGLG